MFRGSFRKSASRGTARRMTLQTSPAESQPSHVPSPPPVSAEVRSIRTSSRHEPAPARSLLDRDRRRHVPLFRRHRRRRRRRDDGRQTRGGVARVSPRRRLRRARGEPAARRLPRRDSTPPRPPPRPIPRRRRQRHAPSRTRPRPPPRRSERRRRGDAPARASLRDRRRREIRAVGSGHRADEGDGPSLAATSRRLAATSRRCATDAATISATRVAASARIGASAASNAFASDGEETPETARRTASSRRRVRRGERLLAHRHEQFEGVLAGTRRAPRFRRHRRRPRPGLRDSTGVPTREPTRRRNRETKPRRARTPRRVGVEPLEFVERRRAPALHQRAFQRRGVLRG